MANTPVTNISQLANLTLTNAFNPAKEVDYLNTSSYPRYGDGNYIFIPNANLLDNAETVAITVNLDKFTTVPVLDIAGDRVVNAETGVQLYDLVDTKTTAPVTAIRETITDITFQTSGSNAIKLLLNSIEINEPVAVNLETIVVYEQPFKIPAGELVSNFIDLLAQNTDFDSYFYITLDAASVNNIGSQANYNNLNLKKHNATYNTGGTAASININRWFLSIDDAVTYDIVGTTYIYSRVVIPKLFKTFTIPTLVSYIYKDNEVIPNIYNYSNDFKIVNISTGDYNILRLKSDPIYTGSTFYDRLTLYSNSTNLSGQDIVCKMQNLKNLYIPKGSTQSTYLYSLINRLPSVTNVSPVTTVAGFDPTVVNSGIVNLNQFPAPTETVDAPSTPGTPETTVIDTNVITDPEMLQLYGNNEKLTITEYATKIAYNINVAEYQSVVNIYEDIAGTRTLLGQTSINQDGSFETYLFNPLTEGNHSVYFTIKDSHYESEASPVISFTIQSALPTAPAISSYYVPNIETVANLNSWETFNELHRAQMYGTTSNQKPFILGFIDPSVILDNDGTRELPTINIFLNGMNVGTTSAFAKSLNVDARAENEYGFIFQLPNLKVGANTIQYSISNAIGTTGALSNAAFIIYEPTQDTVNHIYIYDELNPVTPYQELTNATVLTIYEDYSNKQYLTLYGTGTKPSSKITITNSDTGTILAEPVSDTDGTWSIVYLFPLGNNHLTITLTDVTGTQVVLTKTLSVVAKTTPTASFNIVTDATDATNRTKIVTLTFSEPVYGFTKDDLIFQKCYFDDTRPITTTDNISFQFYVILTDNYNVVYNDGFITLRDKSVYSQNGIFNQVISSESINNNPLVQMVNSIDYSQPFTPIIKLIVNDTRFGNRVINDGDVIDDNNPKFSGTNIGAWVADTLITLPLTRSMKLPKNNNFHTETIYMSAFDKNRAIITEIQTPSDETIASKFCYLKAVNKYFDYGFYKDKDSYIFPEYGSDGSLYYRTISITVDNSTGELVYGTESKLIKVDPSLGSATTGGAVILLNNQVLGSNVDGEYIITPSSIQKPVTSYQIISNDYSSYTRSAVIQIERYLIIFAGQHSVDFVMEINNSIGLAAIQNKYYTEEFTLDYVPENELLTAPAIFPFTETFEMVTAPVSGQYVAFSRINHTATQNGKYSFSLIDSENNPIQATAPVIIKLNMFYNDKLLANHNSGKTLILPIEPYQPIDNSFIKYFSWINMSTISTNLQLVPGAAGAKDKISYTITRSTITGSYTINFYTIKRIPFTAYNLVTGSAGSAQADGSKQYLYSTLNEFDFGFGSVTDTGATMTAIEIVNDNGVPFQDMFRINYNSKLDKNMPGEKIRIYPYRISNPTLYENLHNVTLDIKISFSTTISQISATFVHDYLPEYELDYFKIIDITNYNGTPVGDINFIKNEYMTDNYFDSVRTNSFNGINYQAMVPGDKNVTDNEIEVITDFSIFATALNNESINIYPNDNNFSFNKPTYTHGLEALDQLSQYGVNKIYELNISAPQTIVKDLGYYGLQDSCTISYDTGSDSYIIKATGPVYLSNRYFEYEEIVNGNLVDPVTSEFINIEKESRLCNHLPSFIWVHLDNINIASSVSDRNYLTLDKILSNNGTGATKYKDLVGRYVKWIWDATAESDFFIEDNQLKSLTTVVGNQLPTTIKGSFRCNNNILADLVGGPTTVFGNYVAKNNKLMTLTGLATSIGGSAHKYYDAGVTQWPEATATSWVQLQALFNDSNSDNWDDNFLEKTKVGSSLDLSFNPLTIDTVSNLGTNYCTVGWNIYLAGTSINYTQTNIDTIRAAFNLPGLIYTNFDEVNYQYLIKKDTDPVVSTNVTNFKNSAFINSTNLFNRTLDIEADYNTDTKLKVGINYVAAPFSDSVKPVSSYVTNATYHETSEEIL